MLATKRVGLFGIVIAGALASACSSQTNERLGEQTQDIQGGTNDGTAHPFVVGVCGGAQGKICQLTCSGALITPNMVVSARHCVQDTSPTIDCATSTFGAALLPANQYFVTTSSTMPGTSTVNKHVVKQILTPQPTGVCGNDISILILNDLVPASEATPAIPGTMYSLTDHTHFSYNGGFTAIGYGITSVSGSDSGTRRIRERIFVDCIPGDAVLDCAAGGVDTSMFDSKEFIGGDGTCEGDSGSSSWEQDKFDMGAFVSMGVLSRGGQNGNTCVGSIYTRLDSWRDFIVQSATTASNNWSLYPKPTPDWTVYTPPPPPGTTTGKDAGTTPAKDSGAASADPCAADPTSCADSGDGTNDTPSHHTTTTTTSGCAMSPRAADPSKPVPWRSVGLVAAIGLFVLRRRRRSA